jgi:3-oxoadipate enol-lactonase
MRRGTARGPCAFGKDGDERHDRNGNGDGGRWLRDRVAHGRSGGRSGDAPVVVLSNSLGTAMDMWSAQVAALAARFRVLRYDTRGHGRSDVPAGAYGLDRLGRDVLDLMDALGIARAHFCGLSLGGMTGQWLGVHAPDRFDRLVLANTAACMGPPSGWQSRIASVLENGMAGMTSAILERWFTPNSAPPRPTASRRCARDCWRRRPRAMPGAAPRSATWTCAR